MKHHFSAITIVLFFLSFNVISQDRAFGRISTEIIPPIIVEEKKQLGFGSFMIDESGGSIILSTENERVADGNIRLVDSPYSAGKFTVIGSPGSLITISMPAKSIHFSVEGNNQLIILDNFTTNIPDCGIQTCQQNGIVEVNIGATLHVEQSSEIKTISDRKTYEIVFMYN